MDQIKIGKFIAECRKEKNMTQTILGDKLGVSFKTVSKWETGRGMPELSLLKPVSETLGITINELLSGERIEKGQYIDKLEENIINTIDYSDKKISQNNNIIGILLLVFGALIIVTAMVIFSAESSWGSIYATLGSIICLFGISRFIKKLKFAKRLAIIVSFFVILVSFLLGIDYLNVRLNGEVPRFRISVMTRNNTVIYETLFYNVYRFNIGTEDEMFVIGRRQSINDMNFHTLTERYGHTWHLNDSEAESPIGENISKTAHLYITLLAHIMNEDVALQYNMQYIAVDIDTFVNSSEEDVIDIIEYLEGYHENVKKASMEDLRNVGLVNEEPPISIEGILISVSNVDFINEDEVIVTISKWTSGRSAIWLEYRAIYKNGEWNLHRLEFFIS